MRLPIDGNARPASTLPKREVIGPRLAQRVEVLCLLALVSLTEPRRRAITRGQGFRRFEYVRAATAHSVTVNTTVPPTLAPSPQTFWKSKLTELNVFEVQTSGEQLETWIVLESMI